MADLLLQSAPSAVGDELSQEVDWGSDTEKTRTEGKLRSMLPASEAWHASECTKDSNLGRALRCIHLRDSGY